MLFSVVAVPFYIPTSDAPVSLNPHHFLLLSVFLMVAILMSVMYIIFNYQQCILQSSLTLWGHVLYIAMFSGKKNVLSELQSIECYLFELFLCFNDNRVFGPLRK